MRQTNNPFIPAFGELPAILMGREQELSDLRAAFSSSTYAPQLCSIFSGARGTGKTSMLLQAREEALQQGWIAVSVSAKEGMLEEIYDAVLQYTRHLVDVAERVRIKQVNLGNLFGVEFEHEEFRRIGWRARMETLLEVLSEYGIGLVFLVDEVRATLPEMISLACDYQIFIGQDYKVALLMAGLPVNILGLFQHETVSFLRRAWHYRMENIPQGALLEGVSQLITQSGKAIDDEALNLIVEVTQGFPFMVQLVGYEVWRQCGEQNTITLDDARAGSAKAMEHMQRSIYEGTYQDLADGDKRFLAAMLPDAQASTLADIAARMGVKSNYASRYKQRLLDQGVIGEYGRNNFKFDIPGFREFFADEVKFELEDARLKRQQALFEQMEADD